MSNIQSSQILTIIESIKTQNDRIAELELRSARREKELAEMATAMDKLGIRIKERIPALFKPKE
jgi:uncharacterized coiled-coil protein SlyX